MIEPDFVEPGFERLHCSGCGMTFWRKPRPRASGHAFCSRQCFAAFHRRLTPKARRWFYGVKEQFPAKACEHCGEQFEPKYYHVRFCSTRCRVAAHRKKAVTQHDKTCPFDAPDR